jgi:endonuclease/exonuclease/phosphatase family metal-dependent hydrolase
VTELTALSWNVFHGRDAPPNPAIQRKAMRLSARPLDDGVYLQLNRSLEREFAGLISASAWSVCLLQEAPPAWADGLGERCSAHVVRSLTSRNQFAPLTRVVARWRPDLLGSWEGGSNMILVRPPWRILQGSTRSLLLNPLAERRLKERRQMIFARVQNTASPHGEVISVANLHLTGERKQAERELRRATRTALGWAQGLPLVLAGDFNLRPRSSEIFAQLERDDGLVGATSADAIDHVLAHGLDLIRPPSPWPDRGRELEVPWNSGTRLIRLSDHAPVEATFGTSRMR